MQCHHFPRLRESALESNSNEGTKGPDRDEDADSQYYASLDPLDHNVVEVYDKRKFCEAE